MTPRPPRLGRVAGLGCLALACGCVAGPPRPSEPVLALIERSEQPIEYALPEHLSLVGRPTVDARTSPDIAPFRVLAREPGLGQAPCVRCHDVPLSSLRQPASGAARAHWSIALAHATRDVLTCATCHATDDVASLTLLGGRRVPIDHAYEVCGQCHAGQVADWAGGAHGKRVGGWSPPRVVLNCTGCHNPHAPVLESRWPARAARSRP